MPLYNEPHQADLFESEIPGDKNFTGNVTFGQTAPLENVNLDIYYKTYKINSAFRNAFSSDTNAPSGGIVQSVQGLLDYSKATPGQATGIEALDCYIATVGEPSPTNTGSLYGLNFSISLDETPSSSQPSGTQYASAIYTFVGINHPLNALGQFTGSTNYLYYNAPTGTTGNNPSHGLFGNLSQLNVNGGTHPNLIGTDISINVNGKAIIDNTCGVRVVGQILGSPIEATGESFSQRTCLFSGQLTVPSSDASNRYIAKEVYGLFLDDVSGLGTEKTYAIYSNGGDSYFAGNVEAQSFRLNNLNTAPASSTDLGSPGEQRWTEDYIYLCTAPNTWKRVALSSF